MKTNKTSKNEKFEALRGLAKRIATILLAGAMIVPVALSASACRVTIKDNGDGSYTITPNPNDQGNNNNNQGSSQGSTNTPQGGQTTPKEPDYSKYSPLLQEVLNDSYYAELYRMWERCELSDGNPLEAIPYDFLASNSEDVEGIKTGAVHVTSDLYTIESEPTYIYDRVQILYNVNDGENYMHQYLLQYQITEQELKDLTMLYNGRYFQGPVMFQRLASKQTPKVIKEFAITEKGYKSIIASCNNKNKYIAGALNYNKIASGTVLSLTPITYRDKEGYDISLYLFRETNYDPVSSCVLYQVNAKMVEFKSRVTFNDGIMDLADLNALEPVLISSTPITYYSLYPCYPLSHFGNLKDPWW